MSPIGRVFLVLNLGLAGAFVAFSGTYLQRADHWRDKYDTIKKDLETQLEDAKKDRKGAQDKFDAANRENAVLISTNKALQTKIEEKERDNSNLQTRLSSLEATMKSADANLGNISSELAAARADSKSAMDKAIAAEATKDEAVAKMNDALKQLQDASHRIQNQETQISDQKATLAMREQKIRQDQVMLDLVNRRYPGIFETLAPRVTGSVSKVGAAGNMVTIALESGADNLKSGHRFAIFSESEGYKGEATVSEIDGTKSFCFARLSLKQGKEIKAGDSASTNLSQGGN